ncbi:MAG: 50S ribosomal protein L6 [Patescibacteria group bacterium]
MSRIGIRPVEVANGVQIEIKHTEAIVRGANGEQTVQIPRGIKVAQKDNTLVVERTGNSKTHRALHGTVRALLNNAVVGVSSNFEKKLELIGIGYRASIEGTTLTLLVGFTHPVKMELPTGVKARVEKNVITVTGPDKQVVGQFCANVRAVRKPEPYKGKGIRYQGEHVRMKQGKAMKAGAA